jgi:hypothetical protein
MYTYVEGRIYRVIYRDVGASRIAYKMALIGSITGTRGPLYISTTINNVSLYS